MEEDVAKIDLLEKQILIDQALIKGLKREEQQLLQFSLRDDTQKLKKNIVDFNNRKYFLTENIESHKEINNLLHDEIALVKDGFQVMVPPITYTDKF